MIEILRFEAEQPGPNFLVLGGIHGNEVAGTEGARIVIDRLRSGDLSLARGSVTFIPVCNPKARAIAERYVDEDLNRRFVLDGPATSYEAKLVRIIAHQIDQADAVLDIHSAGSPTDPFLFLDDTEDRTVALARSLGVEKAVTGWAEVYGDAPDLNSGDTIGYARARGKIGILLEAGHHDDADGARVAKRSILGAIRTLNGAQLDGDVGRPSAEAPGPRIVTIHTIVRRSDETAELAKPWRNFEPVKRGDILAKSTGQGAVTADRDSVIVLPKYNAKPGKEWFYLAS